jgi:sec-independent protein translocase protein TatA
LIGGLGWQELLIVLLIVIVIFGAGKLPEIGSGLGKGIKEFKKETGVGDNDGKDKKKLVKGAAEPASSLTQASAEAREKVEAGVNGRERQEVRAENI